MRCGGDGELRRERGMQSPRIKKQKSALVFQLLKIELIGENILS